MGPVLALVGPERLHMLCMFAPTNFERGHILLGVHAQAVPSNTNIPHMFHDLLAFPTSAF